ncbi:MAG: zinc ABC transporter substrate-binding protein [Candidatus Poribacteria bacterium]|nr:zinc ABC transporter substrate-binding protein [Candidatus Poribacteria bacterium]
MIINSTVFFLTCSQQEKGKKHSGEKLDVVATIGMIADITKAVGDSHVNVTVLMGPGIDPHLYKATAGDVSRLSGAKVIFYNGLHLEAKMAEVLERMSTQVKTVAVTDGIDRSILLTPPEFEGAFDPHVWFDVALWKRAVEIVRDTLVETDARHSESYRRNSAVYLAELDELHEYVRTQAERVPENQRVLVTAHDAFNYFGRAYGFQVRGLQGISTVTEAGTADIQELAKFIVQRRIPAMFVETSVSSRNIEAVQASVRSQGFGVEIGGQLFSDAMGDPGTPEGTYIGMVRHNIDTIVESLVQGDKQVLK